MALKKSQLYSSLWSSCDELRGGMDASQYKDYVLVLLFIKYVSDKYAGVPYAPITIPEGASFKDMVALKGKSDIGDQINKKIIAPLANANKLSDMPDFNDATKLGSGKEMVDRLTNLVAIFENKALDFSKNRAEGDDILGDAYEFLMRHFATQSGKSKGQFYTPAEVSRIIAQIIGIHDAKTTSDTTVYDPTCGSGSLLLKVSDEARTAVTLYGQEKDAATSGLARMNMILHNNPTALIGQGNTLADPKFKDGDTLKTFDYVVANPPFSDKRWSTGIDPLNDPFERFQPFGTPPGKQGDYAYLLHIVRSLKSTGPSGSGKGACILPHGVLFRGNAEADIRRNLIRKGYLKGIIGLPANLFFGTGIPACIVVVDKQDAHTRKGIFMVDASAGFMKEGPKNRLRSQDIHKIVDVFNKRLDVPKYSRMVSFAEIEKNEFNLNLPRYIDSQEPEDLQDIEGHLKGGIPNRDIDAMEKHWSICPNLKAALFQPLRPNYSQLSILPSQLKSTIYEHQEFATFITGMNAHFAEWQKKTAKTLKALKSDCHPKEIIVALSEDLLAHYTGKPLIDNYDVYQHLMDYWAETMQDDCYLIADDGWKAETTRIIEKDKKGKEKDKGWICDLVPKSLIVARYFAREQEAIDKLVAELETVTAQITELEEEYGGEDGAFSELDKVNKASVGARLKELKIENGELIAEEKKVLEEWLKLSNQEAELKKKLKDAEAELDAKAYAQYLKLTEAEIQTLVVDDKWLAALDRDIHGEMDRISQTLTQRVKELAERYETPIPQMVSRVAELEVKVNRHLATMGFSLNGELKMVQGAMQELLTGKKRLPGFETKPGYKQTEVGIIPEDWDLDYIENLSHITTGGRNRQDRVNDGQYPFFVRSQTVERINSYSFEGEAVLTAGDGVGTGKVFHYINGKFDVHQRVYRISDFSEQINGYFFYLYFSSHFYGRIMQMTAKSSVDSVRREMIAKMLIPFPSTKAEQEAIAGALSDADALIESLEQLLTKKRHLKQGAMQELLTGKKRLPGFSGEWEIKRLGEMLTICHGRSQRDVEAMDGLYPILATGGEIGRTNRFLYDKPSVLIGRKGTIDQPQYMDTPFWTVDTLFYSDVHAPNHAKFIFYRCCLINWKQHNEASGVPSLNARTIEAIEINRPDPDEQSAIAAILSDMDAEIAALETKLAKTRQLKQGMMQELLTGKIRLI